MSKTIPPARTFISFDWAMKRLFKQKSNHDILEGFLSELFRFDVRVTVILDSESIAEKKNDKTNRVDLLCKNEQDELIIIEMQYFRETDYFQRMLFGASKLVLEYLDKKLPYGKIKRSIPSTSCTSTWVKAKTMCTAVGNNSLGSIKTTPSNWGVPNAEDLVEPFQPIYTRILYHKYQ